MSKIVVYTLPRVFYTRSVLLEVGTTFADVASRVEAHAGLGDSSLQLPRASDHAWTEWKAGEVVCSVGEVPSKL